MSAIAVGVRPLLLGVSLGAALGTALALPSVRTAAAHVADDAATVSSLRTARRASGLTANLLAPGGLIVASGRMGNSAALAAGLLAAAAAVTGAYWGVRQLTEA
jgi:hypothetical protein